jgi:hypothetical protein
LKLLDITSLCVIHPIDLKFYKFSLNWKYSIRKYTTTTRVNNNNNNNNIKTPGTCSTEENIKSTVSIDNKENEQRNATDGELSNKKTSSNEENEIVPFKNKS